MGKRLLIVDDAPIIRSMLRDIVEEDGFEVLAECGNGNEAVAKYRELKPDLVTMDIVMPEKDGLDALQEILALDPHAKIVMVTAVDQRVSLMKAIRAGAIDYIIKPFESERVLAALRSALAIGQGDGNA